MVSPTPHQSNPHVACRFRQRSTVAESARAPTRDAPIRNRMYCCIQFGIERHALLAATLAAIAVSSRPGTRRYLHIHQNPQETP